MLASLLNLLLAGLVALVCLAGGRALLLLLGFRFASPSEEAVLSAGAGFGILIYAMVLLGVAGLYGPPIAWALLLVLALVGFPGWQSWHTWPSWPELGADIRRLSWPLRLLLVVLLVYSVAYTIVALTPTLEGDSIGGYLLTAREYARQGGIVSVDYAYTDTYPANGQMLSTFGFLLRGQILGQLLLVWLMGLLALATLYAFGRTWLSRSTALVAMAAWYGMYSVSYLATSGKIDLAWAAFDLLALLTFSRWYFAQSGERQWRWLVLAGFFLGVAGGAKQASVFTAIALSAAVAVRLWQDDQRRPRAWVGTYLALGLPTALAALWAVRTYLMTGGLGFTGKGLPGDEGALGLLRTVWAMSMLGNAGAIEGPLGKPVGPILLATLPLLVLLRRVDREILHLLAFSGIMILLWFQGVQRARHMLPTLAVLALVSGYVIVRLLAERRWFGQVLVAAMLLALVTNLSLWSYINLVSIQRIPYVLGLHNRNRYLEANLAKAKWYPNYSILRYIWDNLPPDVRIAALSTGNSYYVERPFYTGWNLNPTNDPNAKGLLQALRTKNITHVFINHYVVERRNLLDAWLLRPEFRSRYLQQLICAQGQCLYVLQTRGFDGRTMAT